jgi:RNA recognition motif-containing protein
VSFRCIR